MRNQDILSCPHKLGEATDGGFLFVTFRGEATPLSEQVHFVVSANGRNWQALAGGRAVLVSDIGEKGARDPFLVRLRDGRGFVLLATDLSIHRNGDWHRAQVSASRSILIWDSDDLVHWSPPRLVPVAPDDAGCAWAPEALYDEESGDYLVFWASRTKRDDFAKHRIWACRTRDFRSFGEPFVYMDKPLDVIDTDIIRDGDTYYRFSKDEVLKAITLESAGSLMGPWRDVTEFSLAQRVGYEGPVGFPLNTTTWCLLLDRYAAGKGYEAFLCDNLSKGQFIPAADFHFPYELRHGGVLPITAAERERLVRTFGEIH